MKSTTNQRRGHVGYNSVAIFIRLAVVASEIGEIPRNSTKIRTYNSSRSLIVTMDVSLNVFEILTHLSRK